MSLLGFGLSGELLFVLSVQPLPAFELHHVGTNQAADRISPQKMIHHIKTNVPAGSTHGDVAAIDAGPQCHSRATMRWLEFPSHIIATPLVLEHARSLSSRHSCFGYVRGGCPYGSELDRRSN